eukprot:jgi/Botrbrau1/3566/Bobra.0078s0023.1
MTSSTNPKSTCRECHDVLIRNRKSRLGHNDNKIREFFIFLHPPGSKGYTVTSPCVMNEFP